MAKEKIISKVIPLTLGVLAFVLLIGYLVFAWQEPTQAPPGGNVPAPINVGTTTQYKAGSLGVGGLLAADSGLLLGNSPVATSGLITWTGSDFQGYTGSQWLSLTAGGGGVSLERVVRLEKCLAQGINNVFCKKIDGSGNCVNQSWGEDSFSECPKSACKGDGNCIDCGICKYFDKGTLTCQNIPTGKDGPDYGLSDFCPAGPCGLAYCNGSGNCSYLTAGEQELPACQRCSGTSEQIQYLTDYTEDNEGSNLCNVTCKGCLNGSCTNLPRAQDDTYGSNTCITNYAAGQIYTCDGSGNCVSPPTEEWCSLYWGNDCEKCGGCKYCIKGCRPSGGCGEPCYSCGNNASRVCWRYKWE